LNQVKPPWLFADDIQLPFSGGHSICLRIEVQPATEIIGVPTGRIRILNKAFEDLAQDQAYQKDYQKVIGQPAAALVGDEAAKVVNKGLKQLFEEFQDGIEYLRRLPNKR